MLMASVGQMPTDDEVSEMIQATPTARGLWTLQFVTLMAHKMGDVKSTQHLKDAFALFDTSGDGYISSEEMQRLMINVGEPVTIDDVKGLIREVDINDDGVIDYREFTRVLTAEKSVVHWRHGQGPRHQQGLEEEEEEQGQDCCLERRGARDCVFVCVCVGCHVSGARVLLLRRRKM